MFFVGLDLGQRQDFSAVAVVEREEQRNMRVRHLERLPLGTPYARVVSRVGEIMRHPALAQASRLVVDATGVGAPVVEMLRAFRPAFRVTAVTITAGEHANGRGEEWHVPKKDLMAGLQVLLENGQLKIPRKLLEAGALVRELTDIRLNPRSGGHVAMGAEGYGEHDDLALAVALACWRARRLEIGFGSQRLI
jgi:phage FluMu gp28-like protein